MNGDYIWRGRLIELRRLRPDDWQALYAAQRSSHDVRLFNGSVENLHSEVEIQQYVTENLSDSYLFAIENDDGDFCGTTAITQRDEANGVFELAVQVFSPYRGRGYARDAMRVLLRYGFCELRMNKANSLTIDLNVASIALHRSLGFVQEGVRRQNVFTDGAYHDEFLFGITKGEFEATET